MLSKPLVTVGFPKAAAREYRRMKWYETTVKRFDRQRTGSVVVDDDQWHHIVGIRDGGSMRISCVQKLAGAGNEADKLFAVGNREHQDCVVA